MIGFAAYRLHYLPLQTKSGGLRVPKMNRKRRVYISDTPRILSYEKVRHNFIVVGDGYAHAFTLDIVAFSPLHLYGVACFSGGE